MTEHEAQAVELFRKCIPYITDGNMELLRRIEGWIALTEMSGKPVSRLVSMESMWQAADTTERQEFLNFLQDQGVQISEVDISFRGNG